MLLRCCDDDVAVVLLWRCYVVDMLVPCCCYVATTVLPCCCHVVAMMVRCCCYYVVTGVALLSRWRCCYDVVATLLRRGCDVATMLMRY